MLRRATRLVPRLGAAAAASAVAYNLSTALSESAPPELGAELASLSTDGEVVENWSGTHSASPSAYFQPETPAAVQRVVDLMGAARRRLRVVGSALSPNGMGLSDDGMLNMAFCAGVVSVDAERRQVTVQAGARVKEVVEALRPHGLTLQNYASIAEQQYRTNYARAHLYKHEQSSLNDVRNEVTPPPRRRRPPPPPRRPVARRRPPPL